MKATKSKYIDERVQQELYKFGSQTRNITVFLIAADVFYKILFLNTEIYAWLFEALAIVISFAYYVTRITLAGLLVLPDDAVERENIKRQITLTGVAGAFSSLAVYIYVYQNSAVDGFSLTQVSLALSTGFLVYLAIISGLSYLSKRRIEKMLNGRDN